MSSMRRARIGWIAGSLLLAVPLAAQDRPTFRSDVNLVSIFATVRDSKGRLETGLTKNDFLLFEDNRPRAIWKFEAGSARPLTIGLLVDTSASMALALDEERKASRRFLLDMLRPQVDRAFIVKFDKVTGFLSGFESSPAKLESSLKQLVPTPSYEVSIAFPKRTTALFDAIFFVSAQLGKEQGRKALIVLSDGMDENSHNPEKAAIRSAQQAEVLVYTIFLPGLDSMPPGGRLINPLDLENPYRLAALRGRDTLSEISQPTGGGSFAVDEGHSIDSIYERIAAELRSEYLIAFEAAGSGAAEGYHSLKLRTKRRGLRVQSREALVVSGSLPGRR